MNAGKYSFCRLITHEYKWSYTSGQIVSTWIVLLMFYADQKTEQGVAKHEYVTLWRYVTTISPNWLTISQQIIAFNDIFHTHNVAFMIPWCKYYTDLYQNLTFYSEGSELWPHRFIYCAILQTLAAPDVFMVTKTCSARDQKVIPVTTNHFGSRNNSSYKILYVYIARETITWH